MSVDVPTPPPPPSESPPPNPKRVASNILDLGRLSLEEQIAKEAVDPAIHPRFEDYKFAFTDFLRSEYRIGLESRPICKAFQQGHCPLGNNCPDRHPHHSNYNNLVCKHWLRGLCKKGETCEFLHEYNLRSMPECSGWKDERSCPNGANDCLYLHLDPMFMKPPCPHYEQGYCPLGPNCGARHAQKDAICKYYIAGFCPNGKSCKIGAHPVWKERSLLPKPEVKRILSEEEQEREREELKEKAKQRREEDRRNYQQNRQYGHEKERPWRAKTRQRY